ncbi:MAG: metal-dependent transcriptional regulator [Rhodothermaceae bacterium]|nr:metal-dependent transcriptional regulator [Rhodothermaceae bacterium]MYE62638.1 metal-dependent transcriptional regulator [Rhodothermaceae bacterium]MYJ20728.1 metal-dependent transcriptional regulator [Rhodothermaceae bacterium]
MLSPAIQDYLKVIFLIQEESVVVTTTDIARAMDVSAASVTGMIKRLDRMKLVVHESYKGVTLTEAGEKIALEIIRHHRLLETYLREILGYSWEKMHDEAEHLEHHISEDFEERIDALLGYPTHDPHGHPIPTQDLKMVRAKTVALSDAPTDQSLSIHHLSDTDTSLLSLLEDIGLMPGREVRIVRRQRNGIIVRVENRGEVLITKKMSGSVYVIA